jgi:hypothetical protein
MIVIKPRLLLNRYNFKNNNYNMIKKIKKTPFLLKKIFFIKHVLKSKIILIVKLTL